MALDLALNSDGDIDLRPGWVTGAEGVAQNIRVRLGTHLGEWRIDASIGLPVYNWLTTKPVDVDAITAFIRRVVRTTPGVISVSGWTGSLNTSTGALSISGQATVEDEAVLVVEAATNLTVRRNGYPVVSRIAVRPIARATP